VDQTAAMPSLDQAQLSALADGVDDLARRTARLADHLEGSDTSDAANALFEAERSLRMAERAMARARRSLPG
jgi:hypothetical protein